MGEHWLRWIVASLAPLAIKRHRLSGGIEEIFTAKQAPSDDDEGGERNTEYHAENSAESVPPEENGNDDDDGVKPCLAPHDAWSEQVALNKLNYAEGDAAPEENTPITRFGNTGGLKIGDKYSGGDADDRSEVRYHVKKPEEQT